MKVETKRREENCMSDTPTPVPGYAAPSAFNPPRVEADPKWEREGPSRTTSKDKPSVRPIPNGGGSS